MRPDPVVSIIIPVYESQSTLEQCLRSIEAQDMREFELILIDSSPSDQCEEIVLTQFPWATYEHFNQRFLPHEARNYGVTKSSTELLIFTDPDVYPPAGWLTKLLNAHSTFGGMVVGSVICHGRKWLDHGTHIAKFDLWLPGGQARPIEIAPTLNLLCPREIYDAVGGFPGEQMIGDTIFSWKVAAEDYRIHFFPEAEVIHHHVSAWSDLLEERFTRGREFGYLRADYAGWTRTRIALHLLLTLSPLRWMNLMLRTFKNAISANMFNLAVATLPISASAQAAWLLGESRGFIDLLARQSRR